MFNILSVEEFAEYRNISKKINREKIEEAINQAQNSDFKEMLGSDFYNDVYNFAKDGLIPYGEIPSLPNFYDYLLSPDNKYYVVDDDNIHRRQLGLKSILADFAYSRYIYTINVNLTPFGAVSKSMEDSEKIERNFIKDLSKQAQKDAFIKFKDVEKYINYCQLNKEILIENYFPFSAKCFLNYCSGENVSPVFNKSKITIL